MDYDDNDFQGQNLHLAGEGSSKFSPVLRPYALPKFDFDDSLQGHIRFDSLVENEVFLGIPSQEDNQWIEDFSRGSSGIEFSSSAAESCSISRRNNVWSEATSSESVEMLLKSVGQEEMVRGETIIEESDACDELGDLTDQMEPHLKQENKLKDVMDPEPALPSDEFLEHFSGLNDVKGASQTQETEISAHGSSHEMGPNDSSAVCGIIVNESNPGVDKKCDDANQSEVNTSLNVCVDNKRDKNSSGSELQIDDMDSSTQDIAASVQVLDTQEPEHQVSDVSFENENCLVKDTGKAVGECQVLSKEADADDQILKGVAVETVTHSLENLLGSSSKAESIELHSVETGINNFEEPAILALKGGGDQQIARDNKDLFSTDPEKASECEPKDLSYSSEIQQHVRGTMHGDLPVVLGDNNLAGRAIEVSNVKAGIHASSELKFDQTTHAENSSVEGKDHLRGSEHKLDREASGSNSEASLFSGVANKQVDGSSNSDVGDLSSLTVACSSTELLGKKHTVEILKVVDDASRVQKESSNAEDHISSCRVSGSEQTFVGNLVPNPKDLHYNQDISLNEKENAKLPNDSNSMDCEIIESLSNVKSVETTSQGEGMEVNNEVVIVSECVTTARNEAALNVAFEKTNLALHDTVDGVPLLSETGATVDQFTGHPDENKKIEDEGTTEASLLSLKESSEGEGKLGPILELEKGASHSSAWKLSHRAVDQSLPTLGTCNSEIGSERSVEILHKTVDQSLPMLENSNTSGSGQAVSASEINQNSYVQLEVCPHLCDSVLKEGIVVEGLVPGNHEGTTVEKNHVAASPKVADSVKLDCGSPTVVSCIVLSQSEKDKEEGVKGSTDKKVPFSELTIQSTSQNVSGNDAAKDERVFSSEVHSSAGLSDRETSKDGQSITPTQTCKMPTLPKIVEGSPSTPSTVQIDSKMVLVPSRGSSLTPDGEIAHGGSKGTPERKTRRASGRSTGKENAKKGKHVKETTPMKLSERGDKSGSAPMSLLGSGQLVQFEGLKPDGNVESSSTIPCGVVSVPTSNLPDLNTSALFQQPFTDLQQVQLRAQIFVYGSVIQGAAPDEACMVSAFGASDGRSVWEPVWRACVERIQGQKSHLNKSETPVQSRSESRNAGARPLDQSTKRGAHQSKMVPSPLVRASSKDTPPPVVNSMIPLSSPLWNISTPDGSQSSSISRTSLLDYHQTLSSFHPFQTPLTRSFVGHTTSWLPQAPFPGPWVASPQTSVDASARFSVLPMTEAVKLTPVKESSALISSGTKNSSLSTMVHTTGPSVLAGTSSLPDMKKMSVLPGQNSTDPKPRKRKKATVSETHGQIPLLVQTQTESVSAPVINSHLSQTESASAPVITSHLSSSVVVSTPACFALEGNAGKIFTVAPLIPSIDHPKRGELNAEQKVIIPEETFSKVEEAKRQAEDAAALAAAAVSHSQNVWSQLDKLKNSGLVPDVKAKLASAAVAVAAAASVAKAAAAAAGIASNAALQAKLMADEALTSGGTSNVAQIPNGNNFGNATSASILKGGDGSDFSSSIIVAAREAVRRRVEAASAASKQAENMVAIVKAAELAADAVSQAGKMVAMGDPLPLNVLIEAGPEGYWRVPQTPSEQGFISNNINREQSNVESIKGGLIVPDRHAKEGLSEEVKTTTGGFSPLLRQVSRESEDHVRAGDGISSSFNTSEKDSRGQRSRRTSDLAKTIGVVPESEFGSRSASIIARDEFEKGLGTLKENIIKEGCHVEVCKDGDVFKTAWFSAEVLSLQDGKAFVCYTDLQSKEGQLKEWVALEGEANHAPKIRMAHPVTTTRFEGTRKRRRAAMGDCVCAIGDRVDVWIQDCWREGVITEKNKKDDTTLTVHFPAEGKTSVVKAWQLRPALIWKDGEWIEWLSLREKDTSSQGDTPQEKRLKLGIPPIEGIEKDRISKKIELVESGKLPLSANEKIFNVGKNIGDENKPNALRATRTGLQKEGSRVIFGVPKPGKKRKFMEVSKHYVAERSSKTNESNEPVKFAKYLMPQGSGSRGWKNTKFDVKQKQAAESKTKVLKSGKPPSVSGRTLPQKDKFLSSSLSAQNDGTTMDNMLKDSLRTDENESGQQSLMESGSFSNIEGAAEGPVLLSSLALPSDASSKKMSSSNAKSELVNRGKLATSSGKLPKVEVKDKHSNGNPGNSVPDIAEPRRSNRKIQPTSRLLEGLQSSLIVSKIPSVPHEKSHRSQNRGTFKGNK